MPVIRRGVVRPRLDVEKGRRCRVQVAFNRMQFGQTRVGDVRPIDVVYPLTLSVYPLPLSKVTERVGLMLRAGQDITVLETIGHTAFLTVMARSCREDRIGDLESLLG
jgi:hypothetical protein